MEQNEVVFDASRPIAINLRTPGGVKTVRVRFPTDDEWIERQRRRKVVIKQLGRGISETIVGNGEDVDAALVAKRSPRSAPTPRPRSTRSKRLRWSSSYRPPRWTMWCRREIPSASPRGSWADPPPTF